MKWNLKNCKKLNKFPNEFNARWVHRISNYPYNNDSPCRDSRNDVAYVRQPRWTYSQRYIRRNRVVSPMEGERTRQIFCILRAKRRACMRIMSCRARSLAVRRRGAAWRGQEAAWKNMNHFSGPLTHLRIRRAALVHAAAFICPAAPWPSLPLGTSVIISWNPARRTERVKRGSKNASIDRSEREPGIRRMSRDTHLSRNSVISLFTRNRHISAPAKWNIFNLFFCWSYYWQFIRDKCLFLRPF